MINLKYNEEELTLQGRRVFKDEKEVGWISYYISQGTNINTIEMLINVARIDLFSSSNVKRMKLKGQEAFDVKQEVECDEDKEMSDPYDFMFFGFPKPLDKS